MAIDIKSDELRPLADWPALLPRRRGGRLINASTMHRWVSTGLHGIKLEVICVGATRCTSLEKLQVFFDRVTRASIPDSIPLADAKTSRQRQRNLAAADRGLDDDEKWSGKPKKNRRHAAKAKS